MWRIGTSNFHMLVLDFQHFTSRTFCSPTRNNASGDTLTQSYAAMTDHHALSHIADIPLSLLHAELRRRQQDEEVTPSKPSCGSNTRISNYNTALHVFALFLILLVSTFACSFPLIVRQFPRLPVPNYTLFLSRHFGTGVLIATAFVHLLPTAFVSLTDPCLPAFWNEGYDPMAGFIAMVSVFVVVGIEMFFASKGARHNHGGGDLEGLRGSGGAHGYEEVRADHGGEARPSAFRGGSAGLGTITSEHQRNESSQLQRSPYVDSPGSTDKPLPSLPPEDRDDDSDLDLDELDPALGEDEDTAPLNGSVDSSHTSYTGNGRQKRSRNVSFADRDTTIPDTPRPLDVAKEQRLILQCLLLEAGILFHSVFIGMALSVSTGAAFVVLFIAIAFHQTFEGLALGARIAAIPSFTTMSYRPWIMSVMYGVTTPIGQAIGLAVHRLYDPQSQFGLLTVGIVNAISSGLLLYAGLVQLLAEDFLSDRSYVDLKGRRRVEASGAVVGGAMLMALVGAFA